MKEIKILDNHKIPRKFRKGYLFYCDDLDGDAPNCEGANWMSKNIYLKIFPSKEIIKESHNLYTDEAIYKNQFKILKSLVVKVNQDGQKGMRP